MKSRVYIETREALIATLCAYHPGIEAYLVNGQHRWLSGKEFEGDLYILRIRDKFALANTKHMDTLNLRTTKNRRTTIGDQSAYGAGQSFGATVNLGKQPKAIGG